MINATLGGVSLDVLKSAGAENLNGKVLIDAANAIDLKTGVLPFGSDTSLAEQIQKAFPQARVVKSLNTMSVSMMLGQESYPAHHSIFMAGNDADAGVAEHAQRARGRSRFIRSRPDAASSLRHDARSCLGQRRIRWPHASLGKS